MSVARELLDGRRRSGPAIVALLALTGLLVAAAPARAHLPTAASSGGGAGGVATIPDEAFLQPEDLGGVGTTPADADLRPYLRPPQPCAGAGGYPVLRLRRASGAISILYPVAETRPTVVLEDLGVYRGAGARRYLRQLTRALARPGGCTDATGQWSLLEYGVAGRDSVLLRLRERIEDYDGDLISRDTYLFVARVGSAVVVLADLGWEIGNGHEAVVRELAPAAVRRAGALG